MARTSETSMNVHETIYKFSVLREVVSKYFSTLSNFSDSD